MDERTIERAINGVSDFYEPSERGEQTESSGQSSVPDSSGGPVEATPTETDEQSGGRKRAYLKEQNKVLTAKLEQHEATIEQQQKRIETLEAELAELRAASEDAQNHAGQSAKSGEEGDADLSHDGSLWDRAKRLIDSEHT